MKKVVRLESNAEDRQIGNERERSQGWNHTKKIDRLESDGEDRKVDDRRSVNLLEGRPA